MTDNILDHIQDVDSHEMVPLQMWGEVFGGAGAKAASVFAETYKADSWGKNTVYREDLKGDTAPITPELVWNEKGPGAPGAFDMSRRLAVLDLMGVHRQLIFPSFGCLGMMLLYASEENFNRFLFVNPSSIDRKAFGRSVIRAHNDWALESLKIDPDRIRPVAMLVTDTVDDMMAEAKRLIAGGARTLWIPTSQPPGGKSPADPALDPFWSLVEKARVAVVSHITGGYDFFKTDIWGQAPALDLQAFQSQEFVGSDIYSLATLRMSVENYLTAMVLGGVFERHPDLRFGAIETGADWAGPLMSSLDMWVSIFPKLAKQLSLSPSEYFARNIRVTPFVFEPVDEYLRRYPKLVDVLVYSSDYPHVEGGKEAKRRFYEKVAPFGPATIEKFFVTNGELLVPA